MIHPGLTKIRLIVAAILFLSLSTRHGVAQVCTPILDCPSGSHVERADYEFERDQPPGTEQVLLCRKAAVTSNPHEGITKASGYYGDCHVAFNVEYDTAGELKAIISYWQNGKLKKYDYRGSNPFAPNATTINDLPFDAEYTESGQRIDPHELALMTWGDSALVRHITSVVPGGLPVSSAPPRVVVWHHKSRRGSVSVAVCPVLAPDATFDLDRATALFREQGLELAFTGIEFRQLIVVSTPQKADERSEATYYYYSVGLDSCKTNVPKKETTCDITVQAYKETVPVKDGILQMSSAIASDDSFTTRIAEKSFEVINPIQRRSFKTCK